MSIIKNKLSLVVVLAFASIYLIWGSTFLAISYGLKGFPPFILSGLRFLTAGLLLLFWQKSKGESFTSLLSWKKNGIVGVLILTGGTGLVAWGEQYVSSTEAAIAIATGPFWFIAMNRKNWKVYFSNKAVVAGLLIGFAGLVLFLKDSIGAGPDGGDGVVRLVAFGVLALSSISWVLGSLYSKNNPGSQSTIMNIAQQLAVAGVASLIIASIRSEWAELTWADVPVSSWAGLLFLIFFGSIVAYISYIWLLSVKEPVLVSTHTYINPIVAVFMGWLIAGESIQSGQFFGLAIILVGVILTNSSAYKIEKRTRVRFRKLGEVVVRVVSPYRYITHCM